VNELEARLSPNPIFTGLLQEDPAESAARQLFGQLEAGHPVRPVVVEHRPYPGTSGETLIYQMSESRMPPVPTDPFPYRASAGVIGRSVVAAGMLRQHIQDRADAEVAAERAAAAVPVVVEGLISATPTGTINLRLRKPGADQ
jgi:hypothetical protein